MFYLVLDSLLNYEYLQIAEFYQRRIDIFIDLKIAIINDNPQDIVIPILVKTQEDGYMSKPFSIFKVAIKWVLI